MANDLTINELAGAVCKAVGFEGRIEHDRSKPNGTPRKLMDGSKIAGLVWKPCVSLEDGMAATYRWFLESKAG